MDACTARGFETRADLEEPSAPSTSGQMRAEDLAVTVSPSTSAGAERLRGGIYPDDFRSLQPGQALLAVEVVPSGPY